MNFRRFKVDISGEQRAKSNYCQNSWSLNLGQHQVNATLQKKAFKNKNPNKIKNKPT